MRNMRPEHGHGPGRERGRRWDRLDGRFRRRRRRARVLLAGGSTGRCGSTISASFWAHRDEPNVLFVHYDDMTADLEGEMRRVARFLGVSSRRAAMAGPVERCTFASMKARSDEIGAFDEASSEARTRSSTRERTDGGETCSPPRNSTPSTARARSFSLPTPCLDRQRRIHQRITASARSRRCSVRCNCCEPPRVRSVRFFV